MDNAIFRSPKVNGRSFDRRGASGVIENKDNNSANALAHAFSVRGADAPQASAFIDDARGGARRREASAN